MKKLFAIIIMMILVAGFVLAEGQGNEGTGQPEGTGQEDAGNAPEGTGQPETTSQAKDTGKPEDAGTPNPVAVEAVKNMMHEQNQVMEQAMDGMGEEVQNVYRNQNQVRLAVQAMLAMEDHIGGIGPQVSEIAREFDNSVQATIQAEEKMVKKSGFARFFSGGDHEAAKVMEQEANKNMEKIQELKQLQEQCECDPEMKAMLQQQIQNMEQEQTRLKEEAQKELKSKGIFGWMWK